jgi:hypothetical protein
MLQTVKISASNDKWTTTARSTVTKVLGLQSCWGTMWVYLTMVWALHLDLHIGVVNRVILTFIFELSEEKH